MAVITISREPGTFGEEIAARLAGRLGFDLVDKARLKQLWTEIDLDESHLGTVDESVPKENHRLDPETEASIKLVPDLIALLAEENDLVVVGRGAQGLFHSRPGTLHVRVVASRRFRVRQLQASAGLSAAKARSQIREMEKDRARYVRFLYNLNWKDPAIYDMILRMDRLSIEQALNLILEAADQMALRQVPRSQIVENLIPETAETRENGPFVNVAEEEFARFLEFYHISYEYEPRTFTLETDAQGKTIEAFTPDFYLSEQDCYIELTTMKQSLVTRKNRKVRKMRRLYPEINLRIFYQRDFYRLMAKFGLLADQPDITDVNTPKDRETSTATPPSPRNKTGEKI